MGTSPGSLIYKTRGIGNNWLPCFICGHKPQQACQFDMAGFVDSELLSVIMLNEPVAMHPIIDMVFEAGLIGTLDYRKSEPHRVQYKFGACGEHVPNLRLLEADTFRTGMITPEMLKRCIPERKKP